MSDYSMVLPLRARGPAGGPGLHLAVVLIIIIIMIIIINNNNNNNSNNTNSACTNNGLAVVLHVVPRVELLGATQRDPIPRNQV